MFQETALSGSQFKPPALPEVSDFNPPHSHAVKEVCPFRGEADITGEISSAISKVDTDYPGVNITPDEGRIRAVNQLNR